MQVFSQSKVGFFDKIMCKKLIGNGNELFYAGRTSEAMFTFKRAKMKNPNSWKANYHLAMSEFYLKSYLSAEDNIVTALKLAGDKGDGELYYMLGRIHHTLNKIDSAKTYYLKSREIFGKRLSKDYDLDILIQQCDFVKNENKNEVVNLRQPFSRKINSKYEEYGAILVYGGKRLYFTARQPETTGNNMNPDDQKFFEDMYMADWDEKSNNWVMNTEWMEDYNTEGFDALNFISRNGMYGLITVNTSASSEKTTSSSEIYEFEVDEEDSSWYVDPIINETINTSYFEGAATITDSLFDEDESYTQTMYFITDRKGDKSLTDIYSIKRIDDQWGVATAEASLNTLGRETTPFVTGDGKYLFFSSDALPGMGGYDVYYCENINGKWSAPMNMGAKINTVNDDTHFQYYPELNKGVISGIYNFDGYFSYDVFEVNLENTDYPFLKKVK
jgi:tetratricopeptide (TPR) repeat protein